MCKKTITATINSSIESFKKQLYFLWVYIRRKITINKLAFDFLCEQKKTKRKAFLIIMDWAQYPLVREKKNWQTSHPLRFKNLTQ